MVATIDGVEQLVSWHKGTVAGISTADGKLLWKFAWQTDRPIPSPAVMPDGKIFLTIGYGGGCSLIQVSKGASGFVVTEIFKGDKRSGATVPPVVFYEGYLYTIGNDKGKGVQCLAPDGTVKWESKQKFGMGSLLVADGVLFAVEGDNGKVHMMEAKPDACVELGSAKILSGDSIWGPMALAEGRLVLRDQKELKCVDVSGK